MSEESKNGSTKNIERVSHVVDIVLKVLAALVIPLILWGVRLEVRQAILDERMVSKEHRINDRILAKETQLRTEISVCQQGISRRRSDILSVQSIVINNSNKLSGLATGIAAANKRLDDILKYFAKNSK